MYNTVKEALEAFKQGQPIVVVDAETRENEGDIVIAAIFADQDKINFCAKEARGLICIAIDNQTADRLDLIKQRSNQSDAFQTAFLDSIDAKEKFGITTGISAAERSITAKRIADVHATAHDFIKPGHLFPVLAKPGGLQQRQGHTEAAVDLCRLTGLPPAAIICEIMDDDGNMMRREELLAFSGRHALKIITIEQLVQYTQDQSNTSIEDASKAVLSEVSCISSAALPTAIGKFVIEIFKNRDTGNEYAVLKHNEKPHLTPIVRIHSECLTGDIFNSQRCDCRSQLDGAMEAIVARGNGFIVYMKGHEGRGIGLSEKIKAYRLQEEGMNTYEADQHLGWDGDHRSYDDAAEILRYLNVNNFDFFTNNPAKKTALKKAGFEFNVFTIPSKKTQHNAQYLSDKIQLSHHTITTT